MVEVMKIMATSFKSPRHVLPHLVPPNLQQATANPRLCWRLLDTHRQVWVSLLWGHRSFLLGAGTHKVLFVPSKSLIPRSCVSSGGSNGDLLQEGLCHICVYCTQSPCPCGSPLLTCTSAGDFLGQTTFSFFNVSFVVISKVYNFQFIFTIEHYFLLTFLYQAVPL